MIGAECLLVLICVVPGILTRNRLDHGYVAPAHPAVTARGGQEFRPTGELAGLPDNAGAAFTTALDDLDNAVAAFPQQSPEEILKMVSRPGRDCMLLWNKDYPSVLYGTPPIRPDSLTANLEACAEAVKRLSR